MGTNHARKGRARRGRALARVADGQLAVREVIRDGYGALETCPVYKVLEAAPTVGPETVREVLSRAHIWPFVPLQDLTELERTTILDKLPVRVK